MSFIVYGAGAIGGAIGGRLAQAGEQVTLIARGAHAAALREHGLRLLSPDDEVTLRLPVAEHPSEIKFKGDEVVLLAVKSQDTVGALDELAAVAPQSIQVANVQNGVVNERTTLRKFPNVVGVNVLMPAQHLSPGVVEVSSAPISGLLDVGRYPSGVDAEVEAIARALSNATFESIPRPDILRWKYRKLLANLANAVIAATGKTAGDDPDADELTRLTREEGSRVLSTANIDVASEAEDKERRGNKVVPRSIAGKPRGGGSSWQSLARGTGTIEADYLNGEIVLLGRLHGVPTPVNALLQQTANQLARARKQPGAVTAAELLALLKA